MLVTRQSRFLSLTKFILRFFSTEESAELPQSVLAVLGKTSSGNIVERLDLKIIDPDQSLRAKKRRLNKQDTNGQDDADYAGSDEDRERGIEAILIMKLVCRHGTLRRFYLLLHH